MAIVCNPMLLVLILLTLSMSVGLNHAHALSCTAVCQPMRLLVSLSNVQLRPHA